MYTKNDKNRIVQHNRVSEHDAIAKRSAVFVSLASSSGFEQQASVYSHGIKFLRVLWYCTLLLIGQEYFKNARRFLTVISYAVRTVLQCTVLREPRLLVRIICTRSTLRISSNRRLYQTVSSLLVEYSTSCTYVTYGTIGVQYN